MPHGFDILGVPDALICSLSDSKFREMLINVGLYGRNPEKVAIRLNSRV
jgi:hypothetical protein